MSNIADYLQEKLSRKQCSHMVSLVQQLSLVPEQHGADDEHERGDTQQHDGNDVERRARSCKALFKTCTGYMYMSHIS